MKLLDLYCGEGLAAWGYWRSSRFSQIVGVDSDVKMRTRYAFDFVCADAIKLDYEFLLQFDFIHASPPCQAYSKMTPDRSKHERLIAATHIMCKATGKPYVIENVEGSSRELRPNLVMNGHAMGLPIDRKRYFHLSELASSRVLIKRGRSISIHGGNFIAKPELISAMGLGDMISRQAINKLTRRGIEQGIPPIMTKYIAEILIPHKFTIG